jgi:hypothetical protein
MEPGTCNVLYIDRNVKEDRCLSSFEDSTTTEDAGWESSHIAENVKLLLNVFGEGLFTTTPDFGSAC